MPSKNERTTPAIEKPSSGRPGRRKTQISPRSGPRNAGLTFSTSTRSPISSVAIIEPDGM